MKSFEFVVIFRGEDAPRVGCEALRNKAYAIMRTDVRSLHEDDYASVMIRIEYGMRGY